MIVVVNKSTGKIHATHTPWEAPEELVLMSYSHELYTFLRVNYLEYNGVLPGDDAPQGIEISTN